MRVLKVDGAFFFGSATAFESEVDKALDIKTLVIDILDIPFIDITAIFTLKDLISKLKSNNIKVIILAKPKHQKKLLKLNTNNIFSHIKFYTDIKELDKYK